MLRTRTTKDREGASRVSLGCPWCDGDLLLDDAPSDRTGWHCTSGSACHAGDYLAQDSSLSFSGLDVAQLVHAFRVAFAVHLNSGVCDAQRTAKKPRMEAAEAHLSQETSCGVSDDPAVSPRSDEASGSRSASGARHRVRLELAPLIVSASPDEFADIIGPVAATQSGADASAHTGLVRQQNHTRARPAFYFLVCPCTGKNEFVA